MYIRFAGGVHTKKEEFSLLFKYVCPYRNKIVLIIVLAILCAFFEAINLSVLVPLLQLINNPNEPGGTLWLILQSFFSIIGVGLTFTSLLILMSILFLIGQSFSYIRKQLQNSVKYQFNSDLMNQLFFKTLHADVKYHYSKKGGTLIETINREAEQASSSIFILSEIISCSFLIAVYLLLLFYISVDLTLICAGVAIISLFLLNFLIVRSKKFGKIVVGVNAEVNEFVHERINLQKLIKIFSTETSEQERFGVLTRSYSENNCAFLMNGVKIETIFQIIIFLIAVIILYVSVMIFNIPLASLLIFIFILIRLTDPLRNLNSQRHLIAGQIASLERVDHIIRELENAKTIDEGALKFSAFMNSIRINAVNFSYNNKNPTLSDISFQINKNEMVAIVGASGSGKSTLVDLIIRLIKPDSGAITIDGTNIKDYTLESYHKKIGFVSQESYIFHDTILNNICYGTDRVSLDEAMAAAKLANAHDFINGLPENYNTVVGERGAKLSGGEKQRLALARALYRNPEILVLDEATSALDSQSEKVIQDSISSIKKKYTIIIIAHRLSTIENADKIIVFEKGRVIEAGSHTELLKNFGLYKKYYDLQLRGHGIDE